MNLSSRTNWFEAPQVAAVRGGSSICHNRAPRRECLPRTARHEAYFLFLISDYEAFRLQNRLLSNCRTISPVGHWNYPINRLVWSPKQSTKYDSGTNRNTKAPIILKILVSGFWEAVFFSSVLIIERTFAVDCLHSCHGALAVQNNGIQDSPVTQKSFFPTSFRGGFCLFL